MKASVKKTLYFARKRYVFWNYGHAESLYQRALQIQEQEAEPQPLLIAHYLRELAHLYRMQGPYEQAEPLYLRALDLRQQYLSSQHADVATTLYDLARLHQLQQQNTEALSLYQQALAILEQVLGPRHSWTEAAWRAYAQRLRDLGREEAVVDVQSAESRENNT